MLSQPLAFAAACQLQEWKWKYLGNPMIDGFIKNLLSLSIVIPANAGIQSLQALMDSYFRRNDSIFDFLRDRHDWRFF